MQSLVRSISIVALASPTLAGTYVVDDNGGFGVSFTDIPQAIAATVAGDVLIVRPGNYSAFVLDKAERLIGDGSGVVHVNGTLAHPDVEVRLIGAGSVAAIAGMNLPYLQLSNSPGLIVLDDVTTLPSTISQCADVRWIHCNLAGFGSAANASIFGDPAMRVDHSRVEVVSSKLTGGNGLDGYQYGDEGGWGSHGVQLLDAAKFHASRSTILGGNGGNVGGWDLYGYGGKGANAVDVHGLAAEPAFALIAGQQADLLRSGYGGHGDVENGTSGIALSGFGANDHVRISGVTALFSPSTQIETPTPDDPSLALISIPTAGQMMTFRVAGPTGASVALLLGRTAQIAPTSGTNEDLLVVPLRTKNLGWIDATGIVSVNIPLPAGTPKGQKYFAQARVTYADNTTHYTNSTPILAR